MYLTFAVLVVDRALSRGQEGDDVPQRFHDLWAAMPNCTKPLKDALLSSAHDLVQRDSNGEMGGAFFDDSRLRFFDAQKADSGVGEDQGRYSRNARPYTYVDIFCLFCAIYVDALLGETNGTLWEKKSYATRT